MLNRAIELSAERPPLSELVDRVHALARHIAAPRTSLAALAGIPAAALLPAAVGWPISAGSLLAAAFAIPIEWLCTRRMTGERGLPSRTLPRYAFASAALLLPRSLATFTVALTASYLPLVPLVTAVCVGLLLAEISLVRLLAWRASLATDGRAISRRLSWLWSCPSALPLAVSMAMLVLPLIGLRLFLVAAATGADGSARLMLAGLHGCVLAAETVASAALAVAAWRLIVGEDELPLADAIEAEARS